MHRREGASRVPDDAIKRKLAQAGYHLDRLRETDEANELAVESCFAAFIACVRSVAMYVHQWQLASGRAAHPKDWSRVNAWEVTLPTDDHDAWRALTRMRNQDIHEEPIIPVGEWSGGLEAPLPMPLGADFVYEVTDRTTGRTFTVDELCERSLRVAEHLLAAYQSL